MFVKCWQLEKTYRKFVDATKLYTGFLLVWKGRQMDSENNHNGAIKILQTFLKTIKTPALRLMKLFFYLLKFSEIYLLCGFLRDEIRHGGCLDEKCAEQEGMY